jgi:hypothetical protein
LGTAGRWFESSCPDQVSLSRRCEIAIGIGLDSPP